jgi:inorganic pyrophosphatase
MLFTANHYPGDYGLIPRTHCGDGDPLDVIILTDKSLLPLTLAEVRVIGIVRMIDSGEQDDKVIGVYDKDPRFAEYQDLGDVPDHIIKEIKHFFETYKELQNKEVQVTDMHDKNVAYQEIENSQKLYQEKFGANN